VILEVEDTGPGIDPAVRDRLFEPGATTKSGGWGVGLSPLRSGSWNGSTGATLRVARTGPDGTVFELRLPAALPKPQRGVGGPEGQVHPPGATFLASPAAFHGLEAAPSTSSPRSG
jgi:hypothetical protein